MKASTSPILTERELRDKIRKQVLGPKLKIKPHSHRFNIHSDELHDMFGNGKIAIIVPSNSPNRDKAKKKVLGRVSVINAKYHASKEVKIQPVLEEVVTPSYIMTLKPKRSKLKILFNEGTDTTTIAIVGSSFVAGKTTIMMKHILPMFYGNKVTPSAMQRKREVFSKDVFSPASLVSGKKPVKKIRYVNTLFSTNTHIDHYKGYADLVRVTGFGEPQQQLIKDMHHINVKTDNKYRFALFIDDILDTRYSKILDNCFLTYRNAEISTCLCTQYIYLLNKKMRGNIQNIVFCQLISDESIETAVKTFLGSFFTKLGVPKEDHINFYREMTRDHNTIHLHQGSNTINFCEAVPITK